MSGLEEVIGYKFRDPRLLEEALTHRSHAAENGGGRDNERLEFLGDSVLGMVVACYLFRQHPDRDEGYLSKLKAALVSHPSLARWGAALGLGRHLRLSYGERMSEGKSSQSRLENAVEALLGAVFIDGGLPAAQALIHKWLATAKPEELDEDYKTRLQILIQKKRQQLPAYECLEESGPEHEKLFVVRAHFADKTLGLGKGKTKKEAMQEAAKQALAYIDAHGVPKPKPSR